MVLVNVDGENVEHCSIALYSASLFSFKLHTIIIIMFITITYHYIPLYIIYIYTYNYIQLYYIHSTDKPSFFWGSPMFGRPTLWPTPTSGPTCHSGWE